MKHDNGNPSRTETEIPLRSAWPPSVKRPFPRNIFARFSKRECEHFLEAVHFAMQAETSDEVRIAIVSQLLRFYQILGGTRPPGEQWNI